MDTTEIGQEMTFSSLVMEAIRTKAISQFIDHIYTAIEEATKPGRAHSTSVMNKESYFHLTPISIKKSNALDKCNGGSKLSRIWSNVNSAALPWSDFTSTATVFCIQLALNNFIWVQFDFDWIKEDNSQWKGKKHGNEEKHHYIHRKSSRSVARVEALRQSPFLSSLQQHSFMYGNINPWQSKLWCPVDYSQSWFSLCVPQFAALKLNVASNIVLPVQHNCQEKFWQSTFLKNQGYVRTLCSLGLISNCSNRSSLRQHCPYSLFRLRHKLG